MSAAQQIITQVTPGAAPGAAAGLSARLPHPALGGTGAGLCPSTGRVPASSAEALQAAAHMAQVHLRRQQRYARQALQLPVPAHLPPIPTPTEPEHPAFIPALASPHAAAPEPRPEPQHGQDQQSATDAAALTPAPAPAPAPTPVTPASMPDVPENPTPAEPEHRAHSTENSTDQHATPHVPTPASTAPADADDHDLGERAPAWHSKPHDALAAPPSPPERRRKSRVFSRLVRVLTCASSSSTSGMAYDGHAHHGPPPHPHPPLPSLSLAPAPETGEGASLSSGTGGLAGTIASTGGKSTMREIATPSPEGTATVTPSAAPLGGSLNPPASSLAPSSHQDVADRVKAPSRSSSATPRPTPIDTAAAQAATHTAQGVPPLRTGTPGPTTDPSPAPPTPSTGQISTPPTPSALHLPHGPRPRPSTDSRKTQTTRNSGLYAMLGGKVLPREETEDVLSGAVVPPGASFGPPTNPPTPTLERHSQTFPRVSQSSDRVLLDQVNAKLQQDPQELQREELVAETDTETNSAPAQGNRKADELGEGEEEVGEEEEIAQGYNLNPTDLDQQWMQWEMEEEQRLISQGGAGIPHDEAGNPCPLLPAVAGKSKKCLVLDLDETLVHSSFKVIPNADFIVPVEIEEAVHEVYVAKRPGVDEFLRRMGEVFEIVVFTASLSKVRRLTPLLTDSRTDATAQYADPVLDLLDIHNVVAHRLFRESCYQHRGTYVKDLSQLGRAVAGTILLDNSPASYIFHPTNAVPVSSWFTDPHDTELLDMCPFLLDLVSVADVRAVLDAAL